MSREASSDKVCTLAASVRLSNPCDGSGDSQLDLQISAQLELVGLRGPEIVLC